MKLVDEADRHPPQRRSRVVGHRSGVFALDKNLAGVRLFEQACDVEQRRLAGARGRNQRHCLARPNRDVDAAENIEPSIALAVVPLDLGEPQSRRAHS